MRCFGQDIKGCEGNYVLYKKIVLNKLKDSLKREDKNSSRDVARSTFCYLLSSLLAPNQNGSMSWHLTGYLEDFDMIGTYNWSKFIIDMLRKQIASSKTLKVGGCTMLLPFWICEHTRLIRPKEDEKFPRFMKWDLDKLHNKIIRLKLPKLNTRYIIILLSMTYVIFTHVLILISFK
ncbi:hypothetical protein ACS0TY_013425 [Phlomoides rotata]